MSRFNKLCVMLAALAMLLAGLYVYTSRLEVDASLRTVPAAYMERDFKEACAALYGEDAAENLDIADFYFVMVRAEAKCLSPFGAEWITLSLDARPEDEAVHAADPGPKDIGAFGTLAGDDALYITLLTRSQEPGRKAWLEYYIRGRYHCFDIE